MNNKLNEIKRWLRADQYKRLCENSDKPDLDNLYLIDPVVILTYRSGKQAVLSHISPDKPFIAFGGFREESTDKFTAQRFNLETLKREEHGKFPVWVGMSFPNPAPNAYEFFDSVRAMHSKNDKYNFMDKMYQSLADPLKNKHVRERIGLVD